MEKPSPQFIKHGVLGSTERYNPEIHNLGETPEQRNTKISEDGTYYTQEELNQMKKEIIPAECPICRQEIDSTENCRECNNSHKFHSRCYTNQALPVNKCPLCQSLDVGNCENVYDVYKGGKRRKSRSIRTYKRRHTRKRRHTPRRKNNRKTSYRYKKH